MATHGMSIDFREVISRYGFDTAKACLRAHHDAVDAIQSLVKEENVNCGFARTGKLNLAPKPAHFDWRAWTRRSWPPWAPAGAGTRSPACPRGAPGCRPTWPA
ncbi:hypothetical protein ACIRD9_40770 [Streptomyces violaceus]|uniref:hypothetical protein n=1 Tax=Streptomyces violaceus TaxID=1936 RepID=UPI003811A244